MIFLLKHYVMFLLKFYCYCAIIGGKNDFLNFMPSIIGHNNNRISVETWRNVSVSWILMFQNKNVTNPLLPFTAKYSMLKGSEVFQNNWICTGWGYSLISCHSKIFCIVELFPIACVENMSVDILSLLNLVPKGGSHEEFFK